MKYFFRLSSKLMSKYLSRSSQTRCWFFYWMYIHGMYVRCCCADGSAFSPADTSTIFRATSCCNSCTISGPTTILSGIYNQIPLTWSKYKLKQKLIHNTIFLSDFKKSYYFFTTTTGPSVFCESEVWVATMCSWTAALFPTTSVCGHK